MANLPAFKTFKTEKSKKQSGAQAFFREISTFFAGWTGAGKFWVLGRFCRLADSVVLGILAAQKAI